MRTSFADPFSIFGEAFASTFGRVAGFFAACWAATAIAASVVEADPFLVLHSPPTWIADVLAGLFQGWGLIAYFALSIIFYLHTYLEAPMAKTLSATILVQSLESMRCWLDLSNLWPWPIRVYVFFALWLAVVVLLLIRSLSRSHPGVAVGPLSCFRHRPPD